MYIPMPHIVPERRACAEGVRCTSARARGRAWSVRVERVRRRADGRAGRAGRAARAARLLKQRRLAQQQPLVPEELHVGERARDRGLELGWHPLLHLPLGAADHKGAQQVARRRELRVVAGDALAARVEVERVVEGRRPGCVRARHATHLAQALEQPAICCGAVCCGWGLGGGGAPL